MNLIVDATSHDLASDYAMMSAELPPHLKVRSWQTKALDFSTNSVRQTRLEAMTISDESLVSSINLVAHFLADASTEPLESKYHVDTIVICASAVLFGAETIFHRLQDGSISAKNLVLCGGLGHSTTLIWEAVSRHPVYSEASTAVHGQPEGRVLEILLHRFFDPSKISESGCRILVEDKSTNCGSNVKETRKLLERVVSLGPPASIMIVQDSTMALRTKASFERVYEDLDKPPAFISFPVVVPSVKLSRPVSDDNHAVSEDVQSSLLPRFQFDVPGLSDSDLWEMSRFIELIIGEVPRLRDDEHGYGPKGRHFIVQVDIPKKVEEAWKLLRSHFGATR